MSLPNALPMVFYAQIQEAEAEHNTVTLPEVTVLPRALPPPLPLPPTPRPSSDFDKLLHDTVYGIQKDVVKIVLLAGTTLVYTAIKEHAASIGLQPRAYYRGAQILLSAFAIASLTASGPIPWTRPAELWLGVRSHPVKAASLVLLVLALDYAGVTKLLVKRFVGVVVPALRRFFVIGQPVKAVTKPSRWQQPLAVAAAAAVGLWQWLRVQEERARVAASQLDLQRLLDARRWPRSVAELSQVLRASEALIVKVFRVLSALLGAGSAIKYLLGTT